MLTTGEVIVYDTAQLVGGSVVIVTFVWVLYKHVTISHNGIDINNS